MNRIKGFALIQALFFMMFIMAAISILMMMSFQRGKIVTGKQLATDAYPMVHSFVEYAKENITNSKLTVNAKEYLDMFPISTEYCQQLVADGFIPKTQDNNQCANTNWGTNLTWSVTIT